MRKPIFSLFVALMLMTSIAHGEDDGDGIRKRVLKKGPPQLAGIGMVPMKHNCTLSYETCAGKCSNVAGCAQECDADCNVCALDFGEEVATVCHK